jgi:hypothetical protein
MHEQGLVDAAFDPQLADRFEERQRFDVADRAANFDQGDVVARSRFLSRTLESVMCGMTCTVAPR